MRTLVVFACLATLAVCATARGMSREVRGAINLAAITQRVPAWQMFKVASCESGFDPNAYNRSSASGLFQVLRSTWLGTPFAVFDVFDPYPNAMAAAWLVKQDGGWSEWRASYACHHLR